MRFALYTVPNALRAFGRVLRSWFREEERVVSTDEVVHMRRIRCALCPHNVGGQCSLCTCFVDLKTYFATESCPDTPPRWKQQTRASKGL